MIKCFSEVDKNSAYRES